MNSFILEFVLSIAN